jgi:hypothetical protein
LQDFRLEYMIDSLPLSTVSEGCLSSIEAGLITLL